MKKLVLASKSPRRHELVQLLGVPYEIITADTDEYIDPSLSPVQNAVQTARGKAQAVIDSLKGHGDSVVMGIDTIVVQGNEILTKPKDREDARRILCLLSGKSHAVLSGVSLIGDDQTVEFCETSYVDFNELSKNELEAYLKTDEPYDKAGAYGIQGTAGLFVKAIHGCYFNIMGFPLSAVYGALKDQFGFDFTWGSHL